MTARECEASRSVAETAVTSLAQAIRPERGFLLGEVGHHESYMLCESSAEKNEQAERGGAERFSMLQPGSLRFYASLRYAPQGCSNSTPLSQWASTGRASQARGFRGFRELQSCVRAASEQRAALSAAARTG